jgi:hypothetical protein
MVMGRGLLIASLEFFEDFLAMDLQVGWGLHTDFYNFAFDADDFHADASVDHDAFTGFAREDEHGEGVELKVQQCRRWSIPPMSDF